MAALLERIKAAPDGLTPYDFLGRAGDAAALVRKGKARWSKRTDGTRVLRATASRRVRATLTGALGTILCNDGRGWITIKWDGAPCPVDWWAPLDRGLLEVVDA
jgi:hypothetical protein